MKVAAIDIGSNSIHMVVARIDADGHFTLLDRAKEMVRLGKGTLAARALSRESMQAGMQALATFKRLADAQQIDRTLAVATSAVREAKNGGDFIAQIGRELGVHVDLITGREEARLIHLAVSNALDLRDGSTALVDIGGGSVELVLSERGVVKAQESLKLGVLRLAERFIEHDPPARDEIEALEDYLDRQLAAFFKRARGLEPTRMIGTSGTVLNLAAIALQMDGGQAPERLHGITLRAKDVQRARKLLVRSDREERQRLPGLDRRRVDSIVPGVVLIDLLMRRLEVGELTTCEWALREGVILDFIRGHRREIEENETIPDPRRRSVVHLGRRLNFEEGHGQQVARAGARTLRPDRRASRARRARAGVAGVRGAAARRRQPHRPRPPPAALILPDPARGAARLRSEGDSASSRRWRVIIARPGRRTTTRRCRRSRAACARWWRRWRRCSASPMRSIAAISAWCASSTVGGRGKDMTITVRPAGGDAELELWAARRKGDLLQEVVRRALDVAAGGMT